MNIRFMIYFIYLTFKTFELFFNVKCNEKAEFNNIDSSLMLIKTRLLEKYRKLLINTLQ